MKTPIVLIVWWLIIWVSIGDTVESINFCKGKETCSKCIRAHPDCAWCVRPKKEGEHCDDWKVISKSCSDSDRVYPQNKLEIKKNKDLNSEAVDEKDLVQLKPQEVFIELRRNVSHKLEIIYKQAENYPVDLYYLMDLSYSMKDDKENLASLGDTLSREMKNITKKFQLGFGSFVEKVTLPYVPFPLKSKEYATPYGFRNYMRLDTDTSRFKKEVNNAEISGNYDAPEAGLDALVQVISCKKEINWRNNSRKLLVFSTDAGYHFAGDGKLAGIVKPNDGNCHLDNTGLYTESLSQDYPSVSQIRNLIRKNNINIIFAVTESQVPLYTSLKKELDGSTVGTLDSTSSNIVALIRDQYNKIRSGVKLRDTANSFIKVNYFSFCLGDVEKQTDTCDNIALGGNVSFTAHIELISCPPEAKEWSGEFQIHPVGLNEAVTVRYHLICQCDCEKSIYQEVNSKNCSGKGTLECGICSCHENRYGKNCECDGKENKTNYNNEPCFRGNDTFECSGRGECMCGQCKCYPREDPNEEISGSHCECDNFSCDRHNNLLCGGPDHGICECGNCACKPGWKGQVCDCKDTNESCIDPVTKKICNEHGECSCGECVCKDTKEERYDGDYCQQCLICPGSCQAYQACAQCKIFNSGPLTKEECKNCTGKYMEMKDNDDISESKECAFTDDNGCRFFFFYKLDEKDLPSVRVKKQKECPKPINALAIGLGVTGGIVAIGLIALLIWKLLTTIHDSREYAKFLKEISEKKWNEGSNPLYKEATSTFQNPAFGNNT